MRFAGLECIYIYMYIDSRFVFQKILPGTRPKAKGKAKAKARAGGVQPQVQLTPSEIATQTRI